MSEWLNFVKEYAKNNNVSYKQALKDASPEYKKRNEVKTEKPTPVKKSSKKLV